MLKGRNPTDTVLEAPDPGRVAGSEGASVATFLPGGWSGSHRFHPQGQEPANDQPLDVAEFQKLHLGTQPGARQPLVRDAAG